MEEPALQLGDINQSSSSNEDDFFSILLSSQAQMAPNNWMDIQPVQQITWTS